MAYRQQRAQLDNSIEQNAEWVSLSHSILTLKINKLKVNQSEFSASIILTKNDGKLSCTKGKQRRSTIVSDCGSHRRTARGRLEEANQCCQQPRNNCCCTGPRTLPKRTVALHFGVTRRRWGSACGAFWNNRQFVRPRRRTSSCRTYLASSREACWNRRASSERKGNSCAVCNQL